MDARCALSSLFSLSRGWRDVLCRRCEVFFSFVGCFLNRKCVVYSASGLLFLAVQSAAISGERWAELERELKVLYPDRAAVLAGGEDMVRKLRAFAAESQGLASEADGVGQARRLAAETLRIIAPDRPRKALEIYEEMVELGPRDDDRAFGLYALGWNAFAFERYLPRPSRRDGSMLPGAIMYWGRLEARYPKSVWAARVARPLRYVRLVKGGVPAPSFEVKCDFQGETIVYSNESLKGQVVLLNFWTFSSSKQKATRDTLVGGLATNLEQYPDLVGKVTVLGINLDHAKETFDRALEEWGRPWPEYWEGKGFATSIAEAFAIPRVPHWGVIGADGRVRYIGAHHPTFLEAASLELRRVRGVAPPATDDGEASPSDHNGNGN